MYDLIDAQKAAIRSLQDKIKDRDDDAMDGFAVLAESLADQRDENKRLQATIADRDATIERLKEHMRQLGFERIAEDEYLCMVCQQVNDHSGECWLQAALGEAK